MQREVIYLIMDIVIKVLTLGRKGKKWPPGSQET